MLLERWKFTFRTKFTRQYHVAESIEMFWLGMWTHTRGYMLREYNILKKFRWSTTFLGKTIDLLLRELQNMYGYDSMSTTMSFC